MPKSEGNQEGGKSNLNEDILKNGSRLGPSIILKGELSGDGDLVIEGHLQGKIDIGTHDLVIEGTSKVKADIRAGNITINGNLEGNILAAESVFISKEATVKGDINAFKISIMDGAQFKGSIKMKKGTPS